MKPWPLLVAGPVGYCGLFTLLGADAGRLPGAAAGLFVYAAASSIVAIVFVTLRQNLSPPALPGRLAAATSSLTNGAYPLSAVIAVTALIVLPAETVVAIAIVGEVGTAFVLPVAVLLRRSVWARESREAGVCNETVL